MTDVVDRATRSRMMSGIRGTNTRPELLVRKALFAQGFRYRLHDRRLPGKPDIVLPRYRAAVFVHGCFWHGHHCRLFRWPATREAFWRAKIAGNHERDGQAIRRLEADGWRVLVVWECALKGPGRRTPEEVGRMVAKWVRGRRRRGSIAGAEK